jgi:hypothetical protein
MRESRTSGSVRGDRGNSVPYRYTYAEHLMHRYRSILAVAPLLLQVAGTGWADTNAIYTGPIDVIDSFNPGVC